MSGFLENYRQVVGSDIIDELHQMATALKGIKILHISSTRQGGGVAEILTMMTHLSKEIGIENHWEVIKGTQGFFECTKAFHNGLQGRSGLNPNQKQLQEFERINAQNAEELKSLLEEAHIVFVHDPQPLGLIHHFPNRKNKWIWRCHIDVSNPNRAIWKYLRNFVVKFDASIFSLADFVQPLPHPIYLVPPSIDPLSEKNMELDKDEIAQVYTRFNIDSSRPFILQVSRFDHFKDPVGVINAYRLAKRFKPSLQLVLAGGGAPDDPEGETVFQEVKTAADGDSDIHVLFLPSNSHRTINALQRASIVAVQKSIKEGFGLTVTEALWKEKPVIGGNTGGIRLQVINHHTGFLVNTPEGAALRIRYLLQHPSLVHEFGQKGRKLVHDHFLLTRHLRDYLTLILAQLNPDGDEIVLGKIGNT